MSHYYAKTENGVEPRHFVEMASRPGELRPTRITDVRKWWKQGEVVVPSVTTVLDVLNKAALINWRVEQHLRIAARISTDSYFSDDGFNIDGYITEVKRLTELEMDKAPSAGSDLHKKLEAYCTFLLDTSDPDYWLCERAWREIEKHAYSVDCPGWSPEVSFVSGLGYGGCVDLLHSEGMIIDFKTKQTAEKFKPGKMCYDEHRMQLAAYREGLEMPKARAVNVFICLEDGQIDFHEHTEDELQHGWDMFQHALALWKLQNRAYS